MIDRNMEIIDVDPRGFANFSAVFPHLSTVSPQLVLWHEEGIPRRMILDKEIQTVSISRVEDARQAAMMLYSRQEGKVRRVVVTDLEGYDSLYAAQNLWPEPDEDKYSYLCRVNQALIKTFDRNVAVYPEPTLDRGPVAFEKMRSFIGRQLPDQCCLIFAVFEEGELYFSFVARIRSHAADLITSFDHWGDTLAGIGLGSRDVEMAVEAVAAQYGPPACALFIERMDFERLYDGRLHEELPYSLILDSRAFGYPSLAEASEEAFLNTAGFFAYAPVRIP